MSDTLVAPSILSADFSNLADEIEKAEKAGADWIHVDVMDGHFVPNITIGAPVVKSIRKTTDLPLDVHLMIENPEKFIADFVAAGSDLITVHYEACEEKLLDLLTLIQSFGIKAGISIKPATQVDVLEDYLPYIDLVLIMSVEPGFGGQEFIYDSLIKITELKAMLAENHFDNIKISVDGGINEKTAEYAVSSGADVLVSGNYLFKSQDMKKIIEKFKSF